MKLLYFSVIERHRSWGAEWSLNTAFHELGHRTVCIDYRENRLRLAAAAKRCPEVDALLVQRGDRFPPELLRAAKVPCFFLATELFRRRDDQHPLFRCGALAHVFVRTQACADAIVERGWQPAERVSILRSAFDPALHRKLPDVASRDLGVLFVGGLTERRRRLLRSLPPDLDVTVTKAFGEEMVRYLNRAKIVLNLHADDDPDTETRIYEALGAGSFVVTEKLSAENPFTSRELVEVDRLEDLEATLRHYLAHEGERERIAANGHAAARRDHTYRARAERIAAVIAAHGAACGPRAPFAADAAWLRFRAAESRQRAMALIRRAARLAAPRRRQAS